MDATLKITAGVDTAPLERGLDRAEKSIKQLEQATKPLTAASNRAGTALQNLGRVASDAPFGFIAIGNNIEPLVQSFQSLSKESGGVGGALKALGSSLLGPTGLLLGFSLVSSAITVAVQKYGSLGAAIDALIGKEDKVRNKISELTKEYEKLDEKIVNTAQLRADSAASVQGEIVQVQSLLSVIQNETSTRKEKETALRSLKKVNDEYFGQLKNEPGLLDKVSAAVDAYTEALVKNAIVKDLTDQYVLANKALRLANDAALLATQNLKNLSSATATSSSAAARFGAAYQDVVAPIANVASSVEQFNAANKIQFQATQNVKNLKKELQDAVVSANALKSVSVEPVVKQLKQKKVKVEAKADFKIPQIDILKANEEINAEFRKLNPEPIPIPFAPFENLGLIKAAIEMANISKAQDVFIEKMKNIYGVMNDLIGPAVDAVFGAIENGQNAFQALGNSLKKFILQLAATVAKAAILAAILQFIPGAGVAMGVTGAVKGATTGFGDLFGTMLGLRRSSAPTFGGGNMGQGGMQLSGQVVFVQRGPDLVGVLNNTNSRIGRVG